MIPQHLSNLSTQGMRASTLAFAFVCLPEAQRRDLRTFYTFCRVVDDIADDSRMPEAEKDRLLCEWLAALEGTGAALPEDLAELIGRTGIERAILKEIVEGMRMDLGVVRYPDFASLRQYCWRVAGAVGLVSVRLFGCDPAACRSYAEHLGLALQLTNILRDVSEDAAMRRVYIPEDLLRRHGLTADDVLSRRPTRALRFVLREMGSSARKAYAAAAAAKPGGEGSRLLAAELMRAFYERTLTAMERDGFPVLERSYRLSKWAKMRIAIGFYLRSVFADALSFSRKSSAQARTSAGILTSSGQPRE